MAVFKCKMCGGSLEINNESVATCEYCGTKQTLPKTRDDSVSNLFNRANNLRLKCEFDKAAQIYEKIIEQHSDEAEAYWGLILCKYGIEYVEEPKTLNRIPTCHRTLYNAIVADADYLSAIKYSDSAQKVIYEAEAHKIDEIQKNILNIVKNEKPFDIFICYKETDENGKRTVDSAIANDIYYQLTQEGFKVFYAAITLEDKLGQEYEPYIFAALSSAKVMLVIGTKFEYFTAVWVKNEWSRFLNFMKTDRNKLLIPCYRDMDAYELPEEFAHLQAQDMSKIGFINDVVRGIKKIVTKEEKQEIKKETIITANTNEEPLLRRAFMFLEDGDWEKADEFCEQVLNLNPENAMAYVGKLMIDFKVATREGLKDNPFPFHGNNNYQKAIRFADDSLKNELEGYIDFINTRNKNAQDEEAYKEAVQCFNSAKLLCDFDNVIQLFEGIKDYKDSLEYIQKAENKKFDILYQDMFDAFKTASTNEQFISAKAMFEEVKKYKTDADFIAKTENEINEIIYQRALTIMETAASENSFNYAAIIFSQVIDYKDSKNLYEICFQKTDELRKDAKFSQGYKLIERYNSYPVEGTLYEIETFEKAKGIFKSLKDWRTSEKYVEKCDQLIESWNKIKEDARLKEEKLRKEEIIRKENAKKIRKMIAIFGSAAIVVILIFLIILNNVIIPLSAYNKAVKLMESGKYDLAIEHFSDLDGYKDSFAMINECNRRKKDDRYNKAVEALQKGQIIFAYNEFVALGNYKDSKQLADSNYDAYKKEKIKFVEVGDYVIFGKYEQDNKTANIREDIEWLVLEKTDDKILVISRYALECKPYNETFELVTWETCTLRNWLNNDFFNNAFSDEEKKNISLTKTNAHVNPVYNTAPGNVTEDKIFLLSIAEANKYFKADSARQCEPTAYTVEKGAHKNNSENGLWWLRTPGKNQMFASSIFVGGSINEDGKLVSDKQTAVRPAMWIDISE